MNRNELISAIAARASLSNSQAEAALAAFTESVTTALKNGDRVQIGGFGTFELHNRKGRPFQNPNTGEQTEVREHDVPFFRASKLLKDQF